MAQTTRRDATFTSNVDLHVSPTGLRMKAKGTAKQQSDCHPERSKGSCVGGRCERDPSLRSRMTGTDYPVNRSPPRLFVMVFSMKDLAKRKRVMARSMRLGHCICNAKKSCPCDVFQQQDVCPCAGESADGHAGPVHLMSLVQSAGCASKIDKATLSRVLAGLPFFDDPRVLVGAPAGDDAGVYRLDDETALVQTVDVFSPSADDPYTFGQIAAANSLSDVYAMGGRPITASP